MTDHYSVRLGGQERIAGYDTQIIVRAHTGQETTFVPVGRLNAWRIEAHSNLVSNKTKVICTYWYTPEVTRVVKILSKSDSTFTGLRSEETYESPSFPKAALQSQN